MNINFNDSTFEKLRFLADREQRSVAAFVSMRMDELAGQLVNTTFSLNTLPEGTQLAHLDPTPRPIPTCKTEQYTMNMGRTVDGEQNYIVLPSDSQDTQRRYAEEQ